LREAARGRQVLLYLGRLHPKKGLTPLLLAWKKVREEHPAQAASWVLAIAGWDQGGHESQLRRLGDEIGLGDAIVFPGPQFGEAREGCYRGCAAFVLPSLSEGLPMVVLEAWSHGKPVLMTPECNLPEGFNADAAIEIEPTPEAIAPGLVRMLEMSGNERLAMGGRGLALVKERFVWQKVAGQMRAVHDWMLGGGDCPESVATMENSPR
jgi:poly(glycerol-phosphate) alpha-glucosyltransferase